VALAIGDRPHAPPRWAVQACVDLRNRERLAASRSNTRFQDQQVGEVLDRIVAHYLEAEYEFEARTGLRVGREPEGATSYKPPSLSKAIRAASAHLIDVDNASDDDLRIIRNAWNDEQDGQRLPTSYFLLEGWHVTRRIDRVIHELESPRYGWPADPSYALWLANRVPD